MKSHRLHQTLVIALLALILPVISTADEGNHRQQVERLFQLTRMSDKIQQSVESVLQLQLRQNPGLKQHENSMRGFFNKHIGWGALRKDITEMYMQKFSEQELEQINNFYITPAGQKVINELPELVQQRNQLAMQRLQQNIGELHKIIGPPPAHKQ